MFGSSFRPRHLLKRPNREHRAALQSRSRVSERAHLHLPQPLRHVLRGLASTHGQPLGKAWVASTVSFTSLIYWLALTEASLTSTATSSGLPRKWRPDTRALVDTRQASKSFLFGFSDKYSLFLLQCTRRRNPLSHHTRWIIKTGTTLQGAQSPGRTPPVGQGTRARVVTHADTTHLLAWQPALRGFFSQTFPGLLACTRANWVYGMGPG